MKHTRKGFILPLALLATLTATTLGGALVSSSWRAARGARLALAGERAFHAANAALVTHASSWTPSRLANVAIGARDTSTSMVDDNTTVRVVAIRTTVTTLLLDAEATVTAGSNIVARRQVTRLLHLDMSVIPVRAALTAFGHVQFSGDATITGQGSSTNGETTCDTDSDTTSYIAFATDSTPVDSTHLFGPRLVRALHSDTTNALRNALWQHLQNVTTSVETVTSPFTILPVETDGICTSQSGEPRRGPLAIHACTSHWPTRVLTSNTGNITLANARHQGTLVIDGNLIVQGALDIRGLLLVKGNIDARAGALHVIGAVLTTHHNNGTSWFDSGTHITWSRCALQRAVTPLALTRSTSALHWAERH